MKKVLLVLGFCLSILSVQAAGYFDSNWYFYLFEESQTTFNKINKNFPQLKADNAFYQLFKDYEKYVYAMNYYDIDTISELGCNMYDGKYEVRGDYRTNKVPLSNYYANNLILTCGEGSTGFSVNIPSLRAKYGQNLSSAYNQWLDYKVNSLVKLNEGSLDTNPDNIRKEIIILENLLTANSDFVASADVAKELFSLFETYTRGIIYDNSWAFDYQTNKLNSEYKLSYEKYLKENTQSIFYPQVKVLYEQLKKNGFKKTESLRSWIQNQD